MDTASKPYNTATGLLAAVLGAALFSGAFWVTSEGGPIPVEWPEIFSSPVHFTPLFALPLGLFWLGGRRLGVMGLLVLAVGMTLVHWLAMTEAISVAQSARQDHLEGVVAGATGGAIGSVGTWLLLILMGPAFRTARAASLMAFGAILLIAIGAYGVGIGSFANLGALVGGRPFTGPELQPADLIVNLYLPWQVVYGATLVALFRARPPLGG